MFIITGRIIKGVGGLYFVDCNNSIYNCSIKGIFRKKNIIPLIGDKVEISVLDEKDRKGYIEKINERENTLIRPKVSNIDLSIIIFSIKSPDINFLLLDKLLILMEIQNIKETVICINKCDLSKEEEIKDIEKVYSKLYKTIFVSTFNNFGIEDLKLIINKKVSVLAGPSGVGKSSIINCINPNINLKVGEISKKISRGKHTTRQVELISLWNGTYIIDSPGFTSLDLSFIKSNNLQLYFKEFAPFYNKCKFNDCNHIFEPNCAIKSQINISISKERYERYLSIFNEIEQKS